MVDMWGVAHERRRMARPWPVPVPGGRHHVVNRGNRCEATFRTDDDGRRLLARLAEPPERFQVEIHAFVLMDNHCHVLMRPQDLNLSRAVQWLQLSSSVRFDRPAAPRAMSSRGVSRPSSSSGRRMSPRLPATFT